jgi:hypothetical protein
LPYRPNKENLSDFKTRELWMERMRRGFRQRQCW